VPAAVTADRGYGQAAVENDLHDLGVRTVAIPRQATTSNADTAGIAPAWRAGTGPRSGADNGVFAHNLIKISALNT
jgi:IS5 family transposase